MSSCKILYIDVGVGGGGVTKLAGMSLVGLGRVNNDLTGCRLLLCKALSLLLSVYMWYTCMLLASRLRRRPYGDSCQVINFRSLSGVFVQLNTSRY